MFQFNKFTKRLDSKTAFVLIEGEAIFTETLYLLNPIYIHKRSPAFSLVSKGKHVSGFFPVNGGGFTGDYKGKGLLIYLKEAGFDLFSTDLFPVELRAKLQTPEFVEELFKARHKTSLV